MAKPEVIANPDGTFTSAYMCGFCQSGKHQLCPRAIENGNKGIYLCPCAEPNCGGKILSCRNCKRVHDDVTPDTRLCVDRDACEARVLAKRNSNPLFQNIVRIQEIHMANKTADAKVKREAKPKTGVCKCGCEGVTKGGNFLPGHDARFVSEQVGFVLAKPSIEAGTRKKVATVSEALGAKFDKSLSLARAKAEKAEKAEAQRQADKKAKAAEAAKAKADKAAAAKA
jgi:hypothetical protein